MDAQDHGIDFLNRAGRDRERCGVRMSVQPRALRSRPLSTLDFEHIKGEQVP